jgi:hypothetical protein
MIDTSLSTFSYPSEQPEHPFNKIWRGDKPGSVRLDGVPKFDDPYLEREWIKVSGDKTL